MKQHVVGVTVGVGLTGSVAAGSYILQPHQYTNQSSEIGFHRWAGFSTSETNSNCPFRKAIGNNMYVYWDLQPILMVQ